ncbi:hypothetical protein HMI55_002299 [Coelomomyces lativittatus]|nr:hypothetical protein HMI56_004113 [Coelomomyces lativittatus]KAJ1503830.1 hypothetical protein HMI55_002299 [Coelomomyces lativittatus]
MPSELTPSTNEGYPPSHPNTLVTPSHSPFCLESTNVTSYVGSYPTHDLEDPSNSSFYSADMQSPPFPSSSTLHHGRFPLSPTSTRKNSPNLVSIPNIDYPPESPNGCYMGIQPYYSHPAHHYSTHSLDMNLSSYSRGMPPPPLMSLQTTDPSTHVTDSMDYISPITTSFPTTSNSLSTHHAPLPSSLSSNPSSSATLASSSVSSGSSVSHVSSFSSLHALPLIAASYLREKLNPSQGSTSSTLSSSSLSTSTTSLSSPSSSSTSLPSSSILSNVLTSSSTSPSSCSSSTPDHQTPSHSLPSGTVVNPPTPHLRHHSAPTLSALLTALSSSFDCMDPLMDRLQKKEHANDSLRLYLPSFISAAEELEVQAKRNSDLLQTVLMHRRVSSSRT